MGDEGHIALLPPLLCLYLLTLVRTVHLPCAHSSPPPLICTPSDSFVIPTLALCLFVPWHSPCTCSFVDPRCSFVHICNPHACLVPCCCCCCCHCCCTYTLTGSLVCVCPLSFSLWYLTCNRIVSFTVCFVLTFYLDSTYL